MSTEDMRLMEKKRKLDVYEGYSELEDEDFVSHTNVGEEDDADEVEEYVDDSGEEYFETDSDREYKEAMLEAIAPLRKLTRDESLEYQKRVEESGGFDAPYFPNADTFGMIVPVFRPEKNENVRDMIAYALGEFNKKHSPNYQFKSLTMATATVDCGFMYYLTFEAAVVGADPNAASETFRAKVWCGIGEVKVLSCEKYITN